MARYFTLFLSTLFSLSLIAQDNYYKAAFNLSGEELKAALHNIIDNHIEYPYTASSTDVWDLLKETDKDPNNPDNVILIYSGRSVNAAQEYNSGSGWTREHVWAKSRGDFGNNEGEGTDAHHLRPCDNSINSTRNNRNFDKCISCKDVIDAGENTGSKYDEKLWSFEPRDEVKGDVARMIFYMVIRYEGDNGELDLELQDELLSRSDKSPLHSNMSTLISWHNQDSISDFERNRNEVIFDLQGNRNPFIDHPNLVNHIWGNQITESWNPNTGVNKGLSAMSIYPNPTTGFLNIEFDFNSLEFIEAATGKSFYFEGSSSINIAALPIGVFILNVKGGIYDNSRTLIVKQ